MSRRNLSQFSTPGYTIDAKDYKDEKCNEAYLERRTLNRKYVGERATTAAGVDAGKEERRKCGEYKDQSDCCEDNNKRDQEDLKGFMQANLRDFNVRTITASTELSKQNQTKTYRCKD